MNRPAATALAALAAGLLAAAPAFGQTALERQVKAAFLGRFPAFVTWPPGTFAGPGAPLTLCVIGQDPFGPALDAGVRGQTVDGRPIIVRRMGALTSPAGCQVAYIGGPGAGSAPAARAAVRAGVLTVTDGAVDGAAIQFVLRANRVRFRIDQGAAAAAGLEISSKLLNLAVEVER